VRVCVRACVRAFGSQVYSDQLKNITGFTQDEIQTVASTGNIGLYFAIVAGLVFDNVVSDVPRMPDMTAHLTPSLSSPLCLPLCHPVCLAWQLTQEMDNVAFLGSPHIKIAVATGPLARLSLFDLRTTFHLHVWVPLSSQ
jgi:hypothetical protein